MRILFGLLSILIVAGIGFMYKTNQLSSLNKEIPGIPGTKLSDLDPRKIVNSYKNTLGDVEKRNQALLTGELDEDKLKALAKTGDGVAPAAANASGAASPAALAPQATAAQKVPVRATRMYRYGMDIEKLSAEEAKPYLGTWVYAMKATNELPVRMTLRPDGAISSVAVKLQPNINASAGDNSTPLWKNAKTGQVIVLAGDKDYIVLTNPAQGLRGTFYRQGADGVTYLKIMEFPLAKY